MERARAAASDEHGRPLGEPRLSALVRDLALTPGGHALALGCGDVELLLRLVAAHPASTGTGVCVDGRALAAGRRAVVERGLQERVELVEADPATFAGRGDVVLCVGDTSAWGDSTDAVRALPSHLAEGGVAVIAAPASPEEGASDRPTLARLVQTAAEAGLEVASAELDLPERATGPAAVAWLIVRPRPAGGPVRPR